MLASAEVRRALDQWVPGPLMTPLLALAHRRPVHRRWLAGMEELRRHHDRIDGRVIGDLGSMKVATGPFLGMSLLREEGWGPDFSSRLLGSYERELHAVIENVVAAEPPLVVDVGCADGYYAVGLARRLPNSTVIGCDIDAGARARTKRLAHANNVGDRVAIKARCRSNYIASLPPGSCVVMDCEGAELELLTPDVVRATPEVVYLVECHDMYRPRASAILQERFSGRRTELIEGVGREPDDYRTLVPSLGDDELIDALKEHRLAPGSWLYVY